MKSASELVLLLSPNALSTNFHYFMKKHPHLPPIRFHDLRHGTATILLALKQHPKVVQEILGHSRAEVTMQIYSHVMPEIHKEAMDQLNKFLLLPPTDVVEDDDQDDAAHQSYG